jgi:hypothetical protein
MREGMRKGMREEMREGMRKGMREEMRGNERGNERIKVYSIIALPFCLTNRESNVITLTHTLL